MKVSFFYLDQKSWALSGPFEEDEIEPMYALDKPIPVLLHTSRTRTMVYCTLIIMCYVHVYVHV